MTPGERVETAGRWLVSVGGTATPGEIGGALGLNRARQAEVIAALRRGGLVTGGRARLSLTPAGYARFAGVGPSHAGDVVDRVAAVVFPARFAAHRALVHLYVSAIVARHHLHEARPGEHLSFVSRGGEGTGKTAVYTLACELAGIDPADAIVDPDGETAAGLAGRRSVGKGGLPDREVPVIATLPAVVFDDVDKVTADVRRAFWPYLSGKTTLSGGRILRPVAAVTYNPRTGHDPDILLPVGWRRRSVLLDADYAGAHRGELRRAIEDYYRPGNAAQRHRDRLDLAACRPPADSLDPPALEIIESASAALVDSDGAWPKTGLELAALGRLGRRGDNNHKRAAIYTIADYLMVASTTPGVVRDGWPQWIASLLAWEANGEPSAYADIVEAYDRAQRGHAVAARTRRIARAVEADSLTHDRAALVAMLEEAAASLDARKLRTWSQAARVKAKAVRAVLVKLRADAGNTKTPAGLDDVKTRAEGHLAAVDTLHRTAQAERQAIEARAAAIRAAEAVQRDARAVESRQAVEYRRQQEREARQIAQQNRRMITATAAQHAAANKARTARRRDLVAKLDRSSTRAGEDVVGWLVAHRVLDVATVTTVHEVPRPLAAVGAWIVGDSAPPPKIEHATSRVYTDRAGGQYIAAQLTMWESPATRAALVAALDAGA